MPAGVKWIIGALIVGTAAGGSYWERERQMANDEIHGTLVAALGDTIAEVVAHSSYPLPVANLTDEDLSAASQPVRFQYHGAGALAFPPTRTVAITSVATIVTGIETAPQLDFLGREQVVALADDVEPRLQAAGWVRDPAAPGVTGRAELQLRLVDPAAPEVTAWHLAVYRLGDVRLTLRLRRVHGTGPNFPAGAYLLNLVWRDDPLRERAEAVADTLRRQDGVSMTVPRAVDPVAYAKRVRALLPR